MENVPYQKNISTSQILFIAKNIPSVGYKRFKILHSPPSVVTSDLTVGSNFLENNWFRLEIDSHGYISSVYDKSSLRELVDTSDSYDFNRVIVGINLEHFLGMNRTVPDSSSTVISIGMSGPVAHSSNAATSC